MPIINGVQIFKAGEWNGDLYTIADLDDMIDAFNKVGFRPPVKLGHSHEIGEQAYGWVQRIYRSGLTLYADLVDITPELYRLIKQRAYDHVSAEVFFGLERDGRKYPRVLKALALLGSETPALSGLAPLRTVVHEIDNPYRAYEFETQREEDETMQPHEDPGGQLLTLAQSYMTDHPSLCFKEALHAVKATPAGQELVAHYIGQTQGRSYAKGAMKTCPACRSPGICRSKDECVIAAKGNEENAYGEGADVEVRNRASDRLTSGKAKNFSEAVRQVLAQDPELAASYSRIVGSWK